MSFLMEIAYDTRRNRRASVFIASYTDEKERYDTGKK
jgi:hypothetical protein